MNDRYREHFLNLYLNVSVAHGNGCSNSYTKREGGLNTHRTLLVTPIMRLRNPVLASIRLEERYERMLLSYDTSKHSRTRPSFLLCLPRILELFALT